MLTIRLHAHGGADRLVAEQRPVPEPGPGEARVRLEAAGLNFIDIYQRTGLYPVPLPATLGQEGAGIVEATGAGVTTVRAGDRVAWVSVLGAYAEHAVVPADRLVPLPDRVSSAEGAAAMLQGLTAQYLVRSTWALRAGETCLVHAAAGGVGLLLVQMAKHLGARVLATCGTDEKAERVRAMGADHVIVYGRERFQARVQELTGGEGVAVAYDSVGADTWEGSLASLAPRGMLVLFGQSSGPVPPVDPLRLSRQGSVFLTRPSLAHYTRTRAELLKRSAELFGWLADGTVRLTIGATFPLADAAAAHRALEGRATVGKVLLRP